VAVADDRFAPAPGNNKRTRQIELTERPVLAFKTGNDEVWTEYGAACRFFLSTRRSRIALIKRQAWPLLGRRLVIVLLLEFLSGVLASLVVGGGLRFDAKVCIAIYGYGVVLLFEIGQRARPGDTQMNGGAVIVRHPIRLADFFFIRQPDMHQGTGMTDACHFSA